MAIGDRTLPSAAEISNITKGIDNVPYKYIPTVAELNALRELQKAISDYLSFLNRRG